MNAFFKFSKELARRDFISFLEEKEIHPSDLISLSIKIKNGKLINEYSGSGFLSGIGGALRGMYHGFRAGFGTKSINSATVTLKKQLHLAYEKFLDSLISIIGNEVAAVRIVTMLRKNADQDIDHRIFGMEPIVPKPEHPSPTSPKRKTEITPEPEDESEKTAPKEEDDGFEGVTPTEDPEEEVIDEPEPDEDEDEEDEPDEDEEKEDEPDEDEEKDEPEEEATEPEGSSLKEQFHTMLTSGNTSEIHEKISNQFPTRGRDNTESLKALIDCLNENETSESYIEEGFGIINQIYSEFDSANKNLAARYSKYVKENLSENLRRILFKEGASSGKELLMNYDQKINVIKGKKAKKYYVDENKIYDTDDLITTFGDPILRIAHLGERNVTVLRRYYEKAKINNIDNRNLLMKIIVDDMGNYIYLTEEDLKKIAGIT